MLADSDTDGISHTPRSTMNRRLRIISARSPASSGTTVIAQRRIRKTGDHDRQAVLADEPFAHQPSGSGT